MIESINTRWIPMEKFEEVSKDFPDTYCILGVHNTFGIGVLINIEGDYHFKYWSNDAHGYGYTNLEEVMFFMA